MMLHQHRTTVGSTMRLLVILIHAPMVGVIPATVTLRSLLLATSRAMPLSAKSPTTVPPLATVEHVDIPRFMGDWHVVGTIPTPFERSMYNPVEHYALNADGTIAVSFSYRRGGYNGPRKCYGGKGVVTDKGTNATWSIRPFWPIKAEYLVAYLAEDYEHAIVARSKRDFLWIMSRSPSVSQTRLAELVNIAVSMGYDRHLIEFPPHAGQFQTVLQNKVSHG